MTQAKPDKDTQQITTVLKETKGSIPFEPPIGVEDAPMNESVVDKDKTSPGPPVTAIQDNTNTQQAHNKPPGDVSAEAKIPSQANPAPFPPTPPLDAPEQEINEQAQAEKPDQEATQDPEGFTVPLEHAKIMADTLLGVTNNILEVGGGYFITIRKHKEFYDFDEVIQIIDKQNVKNIKRLKLDEEDKALLRPLLIQVLRKQSKAISVESQLITVALSIVMKKARVVMEIRAENEAMVERIRDVIRQELAAARPVNVAESKQQEESGHEEAEEEAEEETPEEEQQIVVTEVTQVSRPPYSGFVRNGIPATVLETNPEPHQ